MTGRPSFQGIANLDSVLAAEAEELPDLPPSTYAMIRNGAAINPAAPALSFFLTAKDYRKPEVWSHARLLADITRTANYFHTLGVGASDVIAFILPNLPETHLTLWGAETTGIAFAINPLLEPSAMASLLRAANARVLVTMGPFPGTDLWQKASAIVGEVPSLRHLVLVDIAQRVRGWRGLLAQAVSLRQRRAQRVSAIASRSGARLEVHPFHRGLRQQPSHRLLSSRTIAAEDPSSYYCTGGTTGAPKIAVRTHRNEVSNAWMGQRILGSAVGPGKTLFCGLPMFHVNAVLVTGLASFAAGAHVVLGTPQGYRGQGVIGQFWKIVERYRINFFSGVPTVYSALLDVPVDGADIASLEYGICGAAPMPRALLSRFQERSGIRILEGYGLTEATCLSTLNPPLGERKVGSIGLRAPWQKMKAVILDAEGRYVRDAEKLETGVIAVSGPNVFAGYREPEQNRNLWIDRHDGLRWLNTGDLGYEDEDGYWWLSGRRKDLIIRGGHNIDPAVIEEPLHRHPAVQLAAAIGRPDVYAGEVPVAYVQLRAGASASEEALLDYLRREIQERAALPKHIRFISDIPLTVIGKVFKPTLRKQEIVDAISEQLSSDVAGPIVVTIDADDSRGLRLKIKVAPASQAEAEAVMRQFPFGYAFDLG